jgi:transcriptional regulator with XRE-family HTH domain/quercetin dioxygenase-like cupin family protein
VSGAPWYGRKVAEPDALGDDHAVVATQRIGERLAYLRAERKLKISDLARRISVSPSLISQIERGQSRPSVTTLFALAQELEVPVDAFFESGPLSDLERGPAEFGRPLPGPAAGSRRDANGSPGESERYLLKHDERPTVEIRGGVRWERLTRSALTDLEFMELVYQPGAESDPQLYRHPGLECVLVIENRLDITIGFEVNRVMAGDSIAFPSSLPHRYVNPTDRVSRAVTVILRDDLSTMPPMVTPAEQSD